MSYGTSDDVVYFYPYKVGHGVYEFALSVHAGKTYVKLFLSEALKIFSILYYQLRVTETQRAMPLE